MLSLLRHRNFALLWWGGTLSRIGTFMLYAALPYFVYATSGSVTASGAAVISEILPSIVFNTVGGVFADRLPRKLVMSLGNVLRGVLILPLLLVHDTSTLWIVYASGFLNSTLASFAGPFGNAALPHIVAEDNLPAANGALAAGENIALLVGSPLGGILLQRFGLGPVVVIDVISFLIPTVAILLINTPLEDRGTPATTPPEDRRSPLGALVDGWTYAWHAPLIRRLFVLALPLYLASGIISVVFVAFVRHVLGGSAAFFSWTLTAQAVSSIAAGLVAGSMLAAGLLALVEVAVAQQPATLVISLLVGGPILFIGAGISTLLQARVSDALRGRVYGTYTSAVNLAGLTGTVAATLLADRLGIRLMFALAGAVLAVTGLVGLRLLPWRV